LSPGEVLLAGGETTVSLSGRRGRGGRSLEFALGASRELDGEADLAILGAGSDGKDGSSAAAGAFADGATMARARARRLDARGALAGHASDAFFRVLGDLLETGPTGTNVADWALAVRAPARGRTGKLRAV
jgi:hydroxypyruvate reductase